MKNLFGSSMTPSEKRESQREMEKEKSDSASRDMSERFGATMTRGEMKSTKRESRKGKR